jgi:hypothetical protein
LTSSPPSKQQPLLQFLISKRVPYAMTLAYLFSDFTYFMTEGHGFYQANQPRFCRLPDH